MRYKVAFETFGCRLNQAETAIFARQFAAAGYELVARTTEADLCVINTCALTSQATSKCRRLVRSIARRNPDACIAAVGCYAQTGAEELKTIDGLDYIVGTSDKMHLLDIIPSPDKLPRPRVVVGKAAREGFTIEGSGFYPHHTRANLKVQEGCNFVCSFCIIPKSRGPARSRDFGDITREAKELVSDGHRELVLTGINIGTYLDRGRTLTDVVAALEEIDGLERIRLSSIEPTTIEGRILGHMGDGGKLCPYLHIPLQSGDDGILERMRRKYTADEYRGFLDEVLARVPGLGLGTDVIVGFPGESEEAFERTYRLVEAVPFNNVHVFSFSAREGTGACRMPDQVPGRVIAERSRLIRRLAKAKRERCYADQVGETHRVLFEEREPEGLFVGFSDHYVKVGVETEENLANTMRDVTVTDVRAADGYRPVLALGRAVAPVSAGSELQRGGGR